MKVFKVLVMSEQLAGRDCNWSLTMLPDEPLNVLAETAEQARVMATAHLAVTMGERRWKIAGVSPLCDVDVYKPETHLAYGGR